jgi:hypothetical protein
LLKKSSSCVRIVDPASMIAVWELGSKYVDTAKIMGNSMFFP